MLQVTTSTHAFTPVATMLVAPRAKQAQTAKPPSALETWKHHMEAKSSATALALAFTPTLVVHVEDDDDDQARGGFKRPRYIIHSDSE